MNAHRGFDGLTTPTGVALMTLALAFFVTVCVVGGLFWRVAARRDREARAALRKPTE